MDWICKNCETKNKLNQSCCYVCGAARDQTNGIDKPLTSEDQRGIDKSTRSIDMKLKIEGIKTPEELSPILLTILTLMFFGLLIGGIK